MVLQELWFGNHFLRGKLCTGAENEIGTTWNPQVKDTIIKAFVDTGAAYARGSADRVFKLLDEYTNNWVIQHTTACEATHIKGEQSGEVLDLRMNCLKKRKLELGSLVKIFEKADDEVVKGAIQASSSLTPVSVCADQKALRAPYPAPKTKNAKAIVTAIREKLVDVEACWRTGKYREGLDLVRELGKKANTLNYQPIQAEVLYQFGELLDSVGEYKEAETTLYDAARAAGKVGDGLLTAKAMTLLVWVIGYRQSRIEEALSLGRDAEIVTGLAGSGDDFRAKLFSNIGILYQRKGFYKKALGFYREVLRLIEGLQNPQPLLKANMFNNMGILFREQFDYEKALDYYRKSLAIKVKVLGTDHPSLANAYNNMGIVYQHQGRYEQALDAYMKTLSIEKHSLGPKHPNLGGTLNNIGIAYRKQRNFKEAVDAFQSAIVIREESHGRDHPDVANPIFNLGTVYQDIGDYDKALECFRRAGNIWEKSFGRSHSEFARSLAGMGSVFKARHDYDKALTFYHEALAIIEKTLGTSHPDLLLSLVSIGQVMLATHRPIPAKKYFERAVNICRKRTCRMELFGKSLFGLARSLVAIGKEKNRAFDLAKQAREVFNDAPKVFKKEIKKVNTWLRNYDETKRSEKATNGDPR